MIFFAVLRVWQVPIFGGLTQAQLEAAREGMIEATFQKGEGVWNEGEEGFTFYVIVEGEAEFYHQGTFEHDLERLKVVGQYEVFGERALLKRQPRYCSVRALTPMVAMKMTQDAFEAATGSTLLEMLPLDYAIREGYREEHMP